LTALLITNLAATVFLAGIAWSLQFVQLPMLTNENAASHRRLNSRLVIVPMIAEAVAAVWLLFDDRSAPVIAALLTWCGVSIGTAGYTLAHSRARLDQLHIWNLVRAIGWTARSAILISIMMK